jgi:Pvc16 N-terminal domain
VSSPLAIGAVSAVLRNLLDNGMVEANTPGGPVKVTAVAPDTIKLDDPALAPSLNLFMYRVSTNQGWSNAAMPSRRPDGSRAANQPLALNLHYLLTAYAGEDLQAEILLGYAMHLLHERPVLDRAAIRAALDPSPLDPSILPPAFAALSASDLADQLENVTLTLEPSGSEEMSRLWTAIQAPYRPTATYVVSVVLIEARKPSFDALPVLSRGEVDPVTKRDRGVVVEPGLQPPYPTIESIEPAHKQPTARLGQPITLHGHHLDGTGAVLRFTHRALEEPIEVNVGTSADPKALQITLPTGAAAEQAWPAGTYSVTLEVLRAGESRPRISNAGAVQLAPAPQLPPTSITRDATTKRVKVVVGVKPRVRALQEAILNIGGHAAVAAPRTTTTASLTFELDVPVAGQQFVRLTVDGVESQLVLHHPAPPKFDPAQRVAVPA